MQSLQPQGMILATARAKDGAMRIGALRVWYLLGVAVVAASLSDPLVESLANRGRLGAMASVPDNDHVSVLPAIALGALVLVSLCAYRAITHAAWAPRTLAELSERVRAVDVGWVIALQLCAVWSMEHLEALAAGSAPPAGWSWLDGPPLASLLLHALIGVAIAALAGRGLATLAAVLAGAVRVLCAIAVALQPRAGAPLVSRSRYPRRHRSSERIARRIAGRAPPLHAAPS